jgi:hypothetical protein
MGVQVSKRPIHVKTGSAVDDITANSLQADSTYTVAAMTVSSGLGVSGGMTASSADITTVSVSSALASQIQRQAAFTTSTGSGGGGAVVSTALAASGIHTLTSTSTTGSTGAQIVHMVTGTAGDHVQFIINSVAATSTPWKIYTSSSASLWDSTSMVVTLSTVGSMVHLVALNSTKWLLVNHIDATLAASS